MTSAVATGLPVTYDVATRRVFSVPAEPLVQDLRTVGGLPFTVFSHVTGTSDDVYANNLLPYYCADVYCETWLFGTTVTLRR